MWQITIRMVPKTKVKMKTFLTALSSVLYLMVYFTPYVLYGKHKCGVGMKTGHENLIIMPKA